MKIFRVATLVVSALTFLVNLMLPAAANHSWGDYHWERSSNPFTLELVDSTSSSATTNWSAVLGLASSDWTDPVVSGAPDVLDTPVTGGTPSSACDPLAGLVRVCNGEYGRNGWLGIATIWINGSHILQGTARVNDSYFDNDYNNANAKRHVLCQEVGHTFGLDHQKGPNSASCMNDMFGLFSDSFVSPNKHDYDQLAKIYCHLDGISTCEGGGGGKGGGKGNGNGKAFVGRDGPHTTVTWIVWVGR